MEPKLNDKQFNLWLPSELWEAVVAFSLKRSAIDGRRISVSEVFRSAVEEYIRTGEEK